MLQTFLQDRLDEMHVWLDKYDHNLEEKDEEILKLKINLETLQLEFKDMRSTYKNRQTAIEEWLEYKEKKRQDEELQLASVYAASRIQVSHFSFQ